MICPWCDEPIEDGEGVPMWAGDLPSPPATVSKATADQPRQPGTFGVTAGELAAAYKALDKTDGVEVNTSPRVQEVKQVGVLGTADYSEAIETETRDNKAGATVRVDLDWERPEPDAVVCEWCHDRVFGEVTVG